MTPGSCTLPNYYSETFVSKRISYIAGHDHQMGAVIIEIEDDDIFHFRQIQCEDDGSFIDMGKQYSHNKKTKGVPVNAIMGDIHGVQADEDAIGMFATLFATMDLRSLYLHDIFDGYSISHHIRDISEKSKRSEDGMGKLVGELEYTYDLVKSISDTTKAKDVFIVKSNHDEFLDRYLKEGRYVFDAENHLISLKIATALFEDEDILQRGFDVVGKESPSHWHYLQRDDSSIIAGVECGSHGDLGLNGAKAALNSLERIYGDCVTGHNHTAAIQRGVFRVGTLSQLDMGYNRGPSSWTQTCCLLYENGQRQLINNINGKCSIL